MEYRVLGPFEVRRGDETLPLGGYRQRAVLAILTLAANRPVAADTLIEQLWSGVPPRSASGTLQSYISELRRLLEPERAPRAPAQVLVSAANGYLLVVPEGALDVDRFLAGTAQARALLADGDPSSAAQHARAALAEWRGPALADFADEAFASPEILRLEEARLQAVELRMEAELAAGHHADVVAELGTLVGEHPLRERLRGHLMLALYRTGRQAEALEVARLGRERLAEELGIDPDPALQELEVAILRQDPELLAAVAPRQVAPVRTGAATPAPAAHHHGRSSDLVGRSEERDVLSRALHTASSGVARVVLVGGEPGIGKTRLAETFAAEVAGAQVVWGRCQETEGAPPFWPWRQVLRSIVSELDEAVVSESLGADAPVVVGAVPELAVHLGDVGSTHLPDAETARFHFFDAVTRLLTAASRHRPVVIVLEDLHWADEPSMALLRFVVGGIRSTGLLLVATYRDVAVTDRSLLASTLGALAREPVVERLRLPGLGPEATRALVAELLDHAPDDELVEAVVERTGGNPLFIIHLVRLLEGADDAAARTIVRHQVPPAVIDLIGLRIAEQPEDTRHLLEVAAVVGRSFDLGLLVQAGGRPFDEAVTAIEPAVGAGLVVEDHEPGTYRFTHALMREAIVAGLGRSRAGRLHGQVGDALAARGVDARSLPTLAHHYWQAARVGWADAALDTATAAAAAAVAGLAYEDAQRHLDHSLALLENQPASEARDRAELAVRLQLATLLMHTRGYAVDEVGQACERARALAAAIPAPAELVVAGFGLAAHHLVRSEHHAALAIAAQLLELGDQQGDPVARLSGHQTTGIPSLYLGRPAQAARNLERAVEIVRDLPPAVTARFPQNVEVGAMAFLAISRWLLGDEAAAEDLRTSSLDRARQLGGYDEVFVLMVSAQLGVLRRDPAQVLEDTAVMLERCGKAGFRHLAAHARVMRGWATAVSHDPTAGVTSIEDGLAYFDAHEPRTRRAHNLTLLAESLHLAGRAHEALAAVDAAVEELAIADERFFEPETWMVRGRLLGDHPRAGESLERAVAAAEAAGSVPLRDRALAALAELVGEDAAAG